MTKKQIWSPRQYSKQARFVSELGAGVVDLLAPGAGERILDLGCGDGQLTKILIDLGCHVVGVDSSPEMVASAKESGLDARVADGQNLTFEDEFDAVFSNAALHWMGHPDRVIRGVWQALKPGGRFAGEFGGRGNVSTIITAMESALARRGIDAQTLNPWYFPDTGEYRTHLENQGFEVKTITMFSRPTPLPDDIVGWLQTFAQSFTTALPQSEQKNFLEEVTKRCRPTLCDAAGNWTADYVRLRFAAIRPHSSLTTSSG